MSIPEPLRAPPRPAEGAQPPHAPQNLLRRMQAILPNESHHLLTAQLVKTGNKSSRLTPSNNWFQTQNTEGLPSKRCCIYIAKESDFRDEMWVFTSKKWLYLTSKLIGFYKVSNLWTTTKVVYGGMWCDFLVWFWFCIIKKYQEQRVIVGEYADILRYK